MGALWSDQKYTAFKDIPSTYVMCLLDRVVPVGQQESIIEKAREVQSTAFDAVERLQSGHEPTLSQVEELVGVVKRAAGE